ncbi:MAG: prepilin-type N-terminal cleavage/methylation domain-containing protein [bacterium]|nr:prepilin-type N-terminal cleavage/methylation domain-containing protein [bacterium]
MNMHKKGFTLIEMIIAIGIFSAVMLTAVWMFTKLNSTQRQNQAKLDVLNEVRFSLDLMGQEILFGYAFPPTPISFPGGCASGCSPTAANHFIFGTKIRSDIPARLIEYYLDSSTGRIMRGEQKFFGPCATTPFPTTDCYAPLTSANVKITQLTYTVSNKGTDLQPIITVTVVGNVREEKFQLSSTYSPRFLQDPNAVPPSDNQLPTIAITSPSQGFITPASSINISGVASDNVGVVSVTWVNQSSGGSGSASAVTAGYATWRALSVPLQSGNNTIIFTAADAAGNVDTDQIVIFSNTPPSTPSLSASGNCNTSSGTVYASLSIGNVGASFYDTEKCAGGSCSAGPWSVLGSNGTTQYHSPLGLGETWSYRARAFGNGQYSPWSSIKTATMPSSCSISAPPVCGDGTCNGGEDYLSCPVDCPAPFCGDGTCNGGETTASCPVDCPVVPGTFYLDISYPPVLIVHVTGNGTNPRTSTSVTISIIDDNYGGSVSFSCGGLPPNSQCKFSPNSPNSPGSTKLRIQVPDNVSDVETDFPITIQGQGGGDTRYVSALLHVIIGGINEN